ILASSAFFLAGPKLVEGRAEGRDLGANLRGAVLTPHGGVADPAELCVGGSDPRFERPAGSREPGHHGHGEHRRREEDRQGDEHASSHAEWVTTRSLSAGDDTL